MKYDHSSFQSQMLWEFILPVWALQYDSLLLPTPVGPLLDGPVICLAPHHGSALPTLFDVASFLPLVVKFILPVFGSFLGCLH